MDYEKLYKEALERAREELGSGCFDRGTVEYIFPELKESGDERIRKALINFVEQYGDNYYGQLAKASAIAWLEKQGKKDKLIKELGKYKVKYTQEVLSQQLEKQGETFTKKDVDDAYLKGISDAKNELEKQSEQIYADKAESKFNVGDWIISPGGCYLHILDIKKDSYLCEDILGEKIKVLCKHSNCDFKSWTIQDAKDGDVLSFNDGHGNDSIELIKSITDKKIEFWFCLTNSNRDEAFDGITPYTNLVSRKNATPATKEQRELLFQKIKEAGYGWDANKKELKKIDDKK